MNDTNSVPEILKDESLFATCALAAAEHVMKQPPYIQRPIIAYGALIDAGIPSGKQAFVNFIRAMALGKVQTWTSQLNDQLYSADLDRLEDTIAQNVYLAYIAQKIESVDPPHPPDGHSRIMRNTL